MPFLVSQPSIGDRHEPSPAARAAKGVVNDFGGGRDGIESMVECMEMFAVNQGLTSGFKCPAHRTVFISHPVGEAAPAIDLLELGVEHVLKGRHFDVVRRTVV